MRKLSLKFSNLLRNRKVLAIYLPVFLLLLAMPVLILTTQKKQNDVQHAAGIGFPHAMGAQLVDGNGNPLQLHGAQIETSFNVMNAWQKQKNSPLYPTNFANPSVFTAMSQWHFNALRLPISNWVYNWDTSSQGTNTYLSVLDQVVSQANQAGLYVVLDLHDDSRAGSPYASASSQFRVATSEMATFWKDMANHYKNNPMVFYDLLNEPYEYNDWNTWLNGGQMLDTAVTPNQTVQALGFQDLVNAVRSTGSQQAVIVEAWQQASQGSFNTIGTNLINDPNVVYSWHTYVITNPRYGSPTYWNSQWGPLLGHYPLYVGEWAFLPNAYHAFMCSTNSGVVYTASQGAQAVTNFFNYLQANTISWTAWQFDQYHQIQDYSTFNGTILTDTAPTGELPESQCCGAGPSASCNYGMGALLQQLMSTSSPSATLSPTAINTSPTPTLFPTPTPAPTATPLPTSTPLPTPTMTPLPTVTPMPTNTPTPRPTATPTPKPTSTPIPTPTPIPPDTTPPTITITYPANGSLIRHSSTITITAIANDNVGVTDVQFLVNGTLLCSDRFPNYSCNWNVPSKPGVTYTITARAFDAMGNANSKSIQVTTTAGNLPPTL